MESFSTTQELAILVTGHSGIPREDGLMYVGVYVTYLLMVIT